METNKIYQGDVLEVLKTFPDESINLVVTSPPYNIGIDYGKYKDNLEWEDYYSWCENWLKELFRVLKSDGRICINHYLSLGNAKKRTAPLMEINSIAMKIGFKHHSVAVWQDITLAKRTAWGSWLSASAPYINSPFEGILILYKETWKRTNKGKDTIKKESFIKLTRGIWEIPTERKQLTKANFPIVLPEKCIELLTFEKDVVLDCFIGSGTTAIACIRTKRNFIGIELSPEYCKVSNERIEKQLEIEK
jgi:site-specific DNA-methyltransferase (adenine-specific)